VRIFYGLKNAECKSKLQEKGGEAVGFQFKLKLGAVLAVLNGASIGLAYIVSQGNITATIVWFAITTGVTAGLSYYKEKQ
jgi:hypothetical protein